jgi:hypothetical protein
VEELQATDSSETAVYIYQSIRSHILGLLNVDFRLCVNLKFHIGKKIHGLKQDEASGHFSVHCVERAVGMISTYHCCGGKQQCTQIF